MPKKKPSEVDVWLGRETPRVRKALENASGYFDANDRLTVNTLEAIYAQESSFGILVGERGSNDAAGHFQFKPRTAIEYRLAASKKNDQRFDIDRAASAAARYLKDLDTFFSKRTTLIRGKETIPVKDSLERKKFALGAFSAGQGYVAGAQRLAEKAGENPQLWSNVEQFLELAGASEKIAADARQYVKEVPSYEIEFAQKSLANKKVKEKGIRKGKYRCTEGRWVTIDDRPVFICD